MVTSNGYTIRFKRSENKIEIILPQTWATLTNTIGEVVDRRDPNDTDLSMILQFTMLLLKEGEE